MRRSEKVQSPGESTLAYEIRIREDELRVLKELSDKSLTLMHNISNPRGLVDWQVGALGYPGTIKQLEICVHLRGSDSSRFKGDVVMDIMLSCGKGFKVRVYHDDFPMESFLAHTERIMEGLVKCRGYAPEFVEVIKDKIFKTVFAKWETSEEVLKHEVDRREKAHSVAVQEFKEISGAYKKWRKNGKRV